MPVDYFQFPVSFSQQRLWILDQMTPGTAFYNLSAGIRLSFPVNILVLKKSLNEIVRRHEILRTTFTEAEGKPAQLVASSMEMELDFRDLWARPAAMREDNVRQLMGAEARLPFNLRHGPLIRASLYKMDPQNYILQVTVHHIIFDAWSQVVFMRELTAIYDSFMQGKSSPLVDLPIQYADFAVWQREHMHGDTLRQHLNYWKRQLEAIPSLDLPHDKKRPAIQSYRGITEYVAIPAPLTAALRVFSQQQGATLFMTLLAAFATLLHRYSGQEDIVVGAPVAGRSQSEMEHLIGFFINSLVIRADLSGDPSFAQLLQRIKIVSLDAVTHSELPFEKLVEELHPDRDLSRNPLFQVSFQIMQFPPLANSPADSVKANLLGFDKGTAIFDLRITLTEENDSISGEIEYSTDLFETATIQRLWTNYQALLEDMIAGPHKRLSQLHLMRDAERHRLLDEWNDTSTRFEATRLLHRLFEQQVIETPDRTALMFGEVEMSYQELNDRSNRLAHFLRAAGLQPGSFAGVYLERSEMMVVAFLAILKAGAAYIPLDPAYPAERTKMIIEDAKVEIIITQSSLAGLLTNMHVQTIVPAEQWLRIMEQPTTNLNLEIHPLQLAYVIYTSGSTGKPKGVTIPHAAICNHMLWMKKEFPLNADDLLMQRTPYSFDASVWEFYAPLISGARLLIANEDGARDPENIIETIVRHSVTVLQLVPSLLKALTAHPNFDLCSSLRRVYCGGEPLGHELIRSFYKLLPAELYNLYGPTEVSIDSTFWHCRVEQDRERVPIGKPIANIRAYVLDEHLDPVPIGVYGELWLGGEGLARGYLGRPGLTASRFAPDPHDHRSGARIYRTGDRVRYRADGNIEYLERIDQQIKLRGYRIEPGEIEDALLAFESVKQALVITQPDINGNDRLAAYLVPHQQESGVTHASALKMFLQQKLPDYMVPSHYVWVDSIPLKTNGKIDRQSLPAIMMRESEPAPTFSAPFTPTEIALAGIWAEVLGEEQIDIHDNFFKQLGGNSLLAIQVMSRVRQRFRVSMGLQSIFVTPTLQGFAAEVDKLLTYQSASTA